MTDRIRFGPAEDRSIRPDERRGGDRSRRKDRNPYFCLGWLMFLFDLQMRIYIFTTIFLMGLATGIHPFPFLARFFRRCLAFFTRPPLATGQIPTRQFTHAIVHMEGRTAAGKAVDEKKKEGSEGLHIHKITIKPGMNSYSKGSIDPIIG
jgi:hypothetical protein